MNTVQAAWEGVAPRIVPADASPAERQALCRAFFVGAWAMFGLIERTGEAGVSEAAGIAMLNGLHDECRAFVDLMLRCPAPAPGRGVAPAAGEGG